MFEPRSRWSRSCESTRRRPPRGVTRKVGSGGTAWLLVPQIIAGRGLILSLVVGPGRPAAGPSTIAVSWAAINTFLRGPPPAVSERSGGRRVAHDAIGPVVVALLGRRHRVRPSSEPLNIPVADPASGSAATSRASPPTRPRHIRRHRSAAARRAGAAQAPPRRRPPLSNTRPDRGAAPSSPPTAGTYSGISSEGAQSAPTAWRLGRPHAGAPAIVSGSSSGVRARTGSARTGSATSPSRAPSR